MVEPAWPSKGSGPQLARAKPEEPPQSGGDAALTRLLYEGPHFARAAEDSIGVLDLVMHIFA